MLLLTETSSGQASSSAKKHQYSFLLTNVDEDEELEGEFELSNFTDRSGGQGAKISLSSGVEDTDDSRDDSRECVPWRAFFTNPASLSLMVCYWTQNLIGFLILSELPSYFTTELGFTLRDAGFASMAPYIAQFASTICFGYVFQILTDKFGWEIRTSRQYAMHICFFGSSICLIICGFVSDGRTALLLLVFAMSFYGACQSGTACNFIEISPRYSAELNTVANIFAGLSGIASPLVVSSFTGFYEGVKGWRIVFILTGVQSLVSSALWYRYQTSYPVPVINTPSNSHQR